MTVLDPSLPAILGGRPAWPAGPPDWPRFEQNVVDTLIQAAHDGSWGKYHGPHVARLTDLLAAAHDCPYVHLCCSGTAAVELALRGLHVGPGDEVVMGAYDFKGNFQDVLALGAMPVLVDVCAANATLDPARLPPALGPRTKAIIVSHLHGGIADMPEIVRIANTQGVPVIEDAAQMPGARVCGKIAGTWGDAGILSFGGSKLVTAGRGGAVLTARADIAQRIKLHVQRGNDAYPLSEIQAAAIGAQWPPLNEFNQRRAATACELAAALKRLGLAAFQNRPGDSQPGYYKLGLYYEREAFGGLPRETFAAAMRTEGVALDAGFRALHATHSSRRFRRASGLEHATRAGETVLTLHHPVLLAGPQAVAAVVEAVAKIARCAGAIQAQATEC